jgi:hypothetical protein
MRALGALLAWAVWLTPAAAQRGENHYLPEQRGQAVVRVERSPIAGAGALERDAVQRNLGRLRDLLLAGAVFHPPLGVEVTGWIRAEPAGTATEGPLSAVGLIQFYPYLLNPKTRQPGRMIVTTSEITLTVNVPDGGPAPCVCGRRCIRRTGRRPAPR